MTWTFWSSAGTGLRRALFILAFAAVSYGGAHAQTITQYFYSYYVQRWDVAGNTGGWIPNTSFSTLSHVGSGGNPGGYVLAAGSLSGAVENSSPLLHGDYRTADVNLLSFDLSLRNGVLNQAAFRVRFRDSTFNGWSFRVNTAGMDSSWRSFSITFDPTWTDAEAMAAGWVSDGSSSVSFSQTMSEVYNPEIRLSGSADLQVGIDNFRRSGAKATWTQVSPAGGPPPNRTGHTSVYDAANNRMIVFGGATGAQVGGPALLNDVWVLSNANGAGAPAWTPLSPSGTPPPPMGLHAAAYDAATNTMIVFGGDPAIGFCFQATNDVWTLSNANGLGGAPQWTKLAPLNGSFPELRQRVRAVYDPTSQRLIAFGGMTQACGTSSNEVWILDGANGQSPVAWSQAHPAGTLPAPVVGHGMAYDQANNRLIVYGGQHANGATGEIWVLSTANSAGGDTPIWTRLDPAGAAPSPRYLHSAVYDPETNELIVFAGASVAAPQGANDVWILSNANGLGGAPTWRQAITNGGPPPRAEHSAVLDSLTGRMTIYAGSVLSNGTYFGSSDVWVLTAALAPNAPPPADTVAPVTTATVDPAPANGWNGGTARVTLNATDTGSGVRSITYVIGGIEPVSTTVQGSTAFFDISAEGVTGISYYAIDNVNNVEPAKSLQVKIDTIAPITGSATTPAITADKTALAPVTVNLNATDNPGGSGVGLIAYDAGAGTVAQSSSSQSFQLTTQGTYDVIYSATDVAGNHETDKHLTIRIGKDTDGDGIPDVDDNCPYKYNPEQEPAACATDYNEVLVVPAGPKQPGEPLWVKATFTNTSGAPLLTFKPDCINTVFEVKDAAGNVIPPIYRERFYVIPRDLVTIAAGAQFSVNCDVSELVQATRLSSTTYDVKATYGNHATDPDGEVNLWIGAVDSPVQKIAIAGSAVEKITAKAAFTPSTWLVQWATFDGTSISADVDFTGTGHAPNEFDAATIRLNGVVPIEGTPVINGNVMKVSFDRVQATRSLGSAVAGSHIASTIQGSNSAKTKFFVAQGPVTLAAAIQVTVDIKPGAFPNTVNLGSNGVVPVAILSTATFDARTVDAMSVTLAGAHVKLKGKGTPISSLQDVNGDGRLDLVVQVSTDALQLTDSDTVAVIEGTTNAANGGIPIIGSDTVRIVP